MLVMTLRTVTFEAPCRSCALPHHGLERPALRLQPRLQPADRRRRLADRGRAAAWRTAPRTRPTARARPRPPVPPPEPVSAAPRPSGRRPAHRLRPASAMGGGDLVGEAAQVLDQHDAQGDRDGPELADGQRLHALIGDQIAAQRLGIEMAVGVGDEGPGEAEHPRIARERPLGELRQLTIVAGRQVLADLADLRFDEMVVVEQPFGGRHDAPPGLDLRDAGAVGREQDGGVLAQPPAQRRNPGRPRGHGLRPREALGVLLQTIDAEQLRAGRRRIRPGRGSRRSTRTRRSKRRSCALRPKAGTARSVAADLRHDQRARSCPRWWCSSTVAPPPARAD